jgi:hypothetical protein
MVYQGWDRGKAIEEMRKGGYGFHAIWGGLVDYLERVDVDALRKQLMVPAGVLPKAAVSRTGREATSTQAPGV